MSKDQPQRNKPCPCGSGRKYKKCCISKVRQAQDTSERTASEMDKATLAAFLTQSQQVMR